MIDLSKLFDVKPNQPFFIKKTKYKITSDNKLLRYDAYEKTYVRSMLELNELVTLKPSQIVKCEYTDEDLTLYTIAYKKGMRFMYTLKGVHSAMERVVFSTDRPTGSRYDTIVDIGLILSNEGYI